ncbi:MAG TPA: PilZ domain-containing protein [Candidatus Baltobacteraceae bacterium]|nr:PilZ domain-containing protein [Candidatus Baltobacteraceae bacterium]
MLRLFGPRPVPLHLKSKLPQLNAFVDLTVAGGGPRGSVCVEAMDARAITVSALPGLRAGATGIFNYHNAAGTFRFSSKCVGLHRTARFAIPAKIESVGGATQRSAVRIDATVQAQWRFAPNGKAMGEYVRSSLTDISRTGASLISERDLKTGTSLEVRFAISSGAAPLVVLGEVMRSAKLETAAKYSLGLRFHGVTPEQDRAIVEFINKRLAERRSRGLA